MTQDRRPNRQQRRRGQGDESRAVPVEFTKSSSYRSIYASGAFGGLTPDGMLNMGLYTEYREFPETLTYNIVGPKEVREDESKRTGRQPWVRELQINVVLTPATARALRDWIDTRLQTLEELRPDSEQLRADTGESEQPS